MTLEQRAALVRKHSQAEANDDIETTLSTLEANPVYTFFPAGRKFTGMENARRYYEILVSEVRPRIQDFTLEGEWINEQSAVQEYTIRVRHDDGVVREHRVVAIFTFGENAILGERQFTDDVFTRMLAGSLWDKLELA